MTRFRLICQRHERRPYLTCLQSTFGPPQSIKGIISTLFYSTHVSRPATTSLLPCSRLLSNAAISTAYLHSSLGIPNQPPSAKAFRQQAHSRCVAITTVPLRSTAFIASPAISDIRGSSLVQSLGNVFVTPQQGCARASKFSTSTNKTQSTLTFTRSYRTFRPFYYQKTSSPCSIYSQKHTITDFTSAKAALSTMSSTTDKPAAPAVKLVTEALDKPSLDNRSYRVIELGNGLEALLVHDSETDKASASLDVGVGNFSDGNDMPGTAHAVEHVSNLHFGCPFYHLCHTNRIM